MNLFDFSTPFDEEEEEPETVEEIKEEKVVEERFVKSPEPLKPEITLDDFAKLDLRVCKVLSAKPMRKTNKLMKIVLHDGMGERVIVSSIADEYTPEELVGKKIIVIVNLKPHKFGNEYSHGMLLAPVNEDGKCRVLFADDASEIGSIVH